jgi:hypothetical protein
MHHGHTRAPVRTARQRAKRIALLSAASFAILGLSATSALAKTPKTVWLCKPGMLKVNPCKEDRTATVVTATGAESLEKQKPANNPPIDCFYVYPTVSEQETVNANLTIEPQETQIAVDQASRFSSVCKVYAPMYPQLTLGAINTPGAVTPENTIIAYLGVLSAFDEYLAKFNKGRGIVLIGHSQGSFNLIQLIKEQIDPNPTLRKKLVSAVLLGGQLIVPEAQRVGGSFQNVPLCHTAVETGCAVAYSSIAKEPPNPSNFGRPESALGVGGTTGIEHPEVACVNPTLLEQNGGTGPLLPYASTTPFPGILGNFMPTPTGSTPWISTPGLLTAQCKHENGASWLQVSPVGTEGDTREIPQETLGPLWGLHLYDVNVALGNLVKTVSLQSQAYGFGG